MAGRGEGGVELGREVRAFTAWQPFSYYVQACDNVQQALRAGAENGPIHKSYVGQRPASSRPSPLSPSPPVCSAPQPHPST